MAVAETPTDEHELVEHWHAVFRHSAGRLGSQWLTALRREGKVLGWRTGTPPRVLVPPKDLGTPGEFVDVGPGAQLLAFAPADWVDATQSSGVLGLVAFDGADTPMFARVHDDAPTMGMRLRACVAKQPVGNAADLWFVRA